MRVIVAGSRGIMNGRLVREAIVASGFAITEVVSGNARGVDRIAEAWARTRGIPVKRFPVTADDWHEKGPAAGPIRNRRMASYVGEGGGLIAVWDGVSRGTRDMISVAGDCGLAIYVHRVR